MFLSIKQLFRTAIPIGLFLCSTFPHLQAQRFEVGLQIHNQPSEDRRYFPSLSEVSFYAWNTGVFLDGGAFLQWNRPKYYLRFSADVLSMTRGLESSNPFIGGSTSEAFRFNGQGLRLGVEMGQNLDLHRKIRLQFGGRVNFGKAFRATKTSEDLQFDSNGDITRWQRILDESSGPTNLDAWLQLRFAYRFVPKFQLGFDFRYGGFMTINNTTSIQTRTVFDQNANVISSDENVTFDQGVSWGFTPLAAPSLFFSYSFGNPQ